VNRAIARSRNNKSLLTAFFKDRDNLSNTSIGELKDVLKAAGSPSQRSSLFRAYVDHWSPSLSDDHVHDLLNLTYKTRDTDDRDYLITRVAHDRFFSSNAAVPPSALTQDANWRSMMYLVDKASSVSRPLRALSTRDELLTQYGKAMGKDFGWAHSEFRSYQATVDAEEAADGD
jgi:hypothetical protein